MEPNIHVVRRCGDKKEQHHDPKDLVDLGSFMFWFRGIRILWTCIF